MKILKPILITFSLFLSCSIMVGQNLVPNPSFEDTVSCPTVFGDFSVSDWSSPTQGSPDYFNSCNSGNAGVPNNALGNQQAILGNAYVGFAIYDTFSTYSYREYLQVQLSQTLASGQQYWVSFYVSLADSSMYAIQELGAYFSPTQINDNISDTALSFIPQIEFNDSIITEKNDWIKISNSFIATGNENYLLIGNFNRSQTTTAIQANNTSQNYSYYYVDNVCVSNDSLTCNQPVSVNEVEFNQSSFNLYPNPANNYFNINNQDSENPINIIIYNTLGQELLQLNNVVEEETRIDISIYNTSLLFIKIESKNKSFTYKLLKS